MPFADELLGPDDATGLVVALEAAHGVALPELRDAAGELGPLALRERADRLRDALLQDVGGGHEELAAVVRGALDGAAPFTGWMLWPVTSAVALRAVEQGTDDAVDDALALFERLTVRFTGEFGIRPLLRHDLDRVLATLLGWAAHPDAGVRRLASEGTRPYLPWATRVPGILARPGVTLPILDALRHDPSEDVRRSVANHLNDLSRDEPALVAETARRWLAEPAPGRERENERLVRHALRTLVKRGDPGALAVLGFAPAEVAVDGPLLDADRVTIGGSLRFRGTVRNAGEAEARLAIDYVVHHRKANGTRTPKVFKLTTATLAPGASIDLDRTHSFRPITTRRYHPGTHAIGLQVNGVATPLVPFELAPEA
ncbi:hypothetical protein SK069_02270 [Patulibacter brassicae]|uniref:DNA alkylation repair protein n=1 Tax=Patulibacter brassicae TaxID=1705717 RepID=A0ABU4VHJ9_9ACTN|nr:hypothetical protein [Patulibacter brassicae]MDX8150406.1 hypothetical protein [Patulibacter brassicae]